MLTQSQNSLNIVRIVLNDVLVSVMIEIFVYKIYITVIFYKTDGLRFPILYTPYGTQIEVAVAKRLI